jgi:solute:Na+ symporter, SSS family
MTYIPLLQASSWMMGGVAGYLLLLLVVGTVTVKLVQKSSRRYIIAGKSLPLFFVGTMLASQAIDGNASLGNAGLVYDFGFWAGASIPIGLGLCLLIVGLVYGPRLNKMAMLTLPDFYFRRYGKPTEAVSGTLMLISFTVLVAGNLAATGFIMNAVFDVPFLLGMAIIALIVMTYVFSGGLFSAAYTDMFNIYVAITALWVGFIYIAAGGTGWTFGEFLDNTPEGFLDLSGLTDIEEGALINWAAILALGLGDVIALDFMERVFAARTPKTARRGAFWGGTLTLFIVVPASFMGIFAITLIPDIEDSFLAFPQIAIEHVPTPLGILMLAGVLGASMSTAAGGSLAVSSVISRNLIQRDILGGLLQGRRMMGDRRLLWTTRATLLPVMGAAVVLGWQIPQPGEFLVLAFDIVFAGAFVPLTFGLFWSKANAPAALTSLILGSSLRLLGFFVTPEDWAGIETLIPPVVSAIAFVAVALATQKRYAGVRLHGVVDYVPPEEHVVEGRDLEGYVAPAPRTVT